MLPSPPSSSTSAADGFESVLTIFRSHVASDPTAPAVRLGGKGGGGGSSSLSLSYAALDERVRHVASGLAAFGVARGSRAAVLLPRSIDLVVASLAVLAAGGCLVPLDPSHPEARNEAIAARAGAVLIVAEGSDDDEAGEEGGGGTTVARCSVAEAMDASSEWNDDGPSGGYRVDPGDPAYVIHTSGTTGDPNGVVVPHGALANYLLWARGAYDAERRRSMPLYSSTAVDMTVTSLFLPLVSGGEVVVYENECSLQALYDVLDDDQSDILKVTPSHIWLVLAHLKKRGRRLEHLSCMIVGGEALPYSLARRAKNEITSDLDLFNEYGPTEATVGCIVHRFDPDADSHCDTVPIGRPIAGMGACLLDANGKPAEEEGELCLSGKGLALGYLGAPRTTRRKFVAVQGERTYRTGDVVRALPCGAFVFLGRIDDQVKFNGHRLEPEGLRAIFQRHPSVEGCAVRLQFTEDLRSALVCYAVVEPGTTTLELRRHAEALLPPAHVPQHILLLPALPVGAGGKLDATRLPSLDHILRKAELRDGGAAPPVPARDPTEETLACIWSDALGIDEVGIEDDFFELGGHSLLSHNIIGSVRESFGVDLKFRDVAQNRTVAAMARLVARLRDEEGGAGATSAPPPPDVVGDGEVPELESSSDGSTTTSSGGSSDEGAAGESLPATITTAVPKANDVASSSDVDRVVGDFYSRFPWPYNSSKFEMPSDPHFEVDMINQELGDFTHSILDASPSVWVAGCGTNQALMSALRFPKAAILGTDLSTSSLDICRKNAREVGVDNLDLRLESVSDARYEEEFDFVICTGVIHYTYDPARALARLARSLKPNGVLELLVYNRYHRSVNGAFQESVRLLTQNLGDGARDAGIARRLASGLSVDGRLGRFVACHRDWEESDACELQVNPVEHSFTVETLRSMADACGLEIVRPCTSLYARLRAETLDWETDFADPELRELYRSLPDVDRWQVTNLLLHERSPMIWFYLRRKGAAWDNRTEEELAGEMLRASFVKARTRQKVFLPDDEDGTFRPSSRSVAYPSGLPDPSVRRIWERFDYERPRRMSDVLGELGVPTSFESLHSIRQKLTIPSFPYLRAVPDHVPQEEDD